MLLSVSVKRAVSEQALALPAHESRAILQDIEVRVFDRKLKLYFLQNYSAHMHILPAEIVLGHLLMDIKAC